MIHNPNGCNDTQPNLFNFLIKFTYFDDNLYTRNIVQAQSNFRVLAVKIDFWEICFLPTGNIWKFSPAILLIFQGKP